MFKMRFDTENQDNETTEIFTTNEESTLRIIEFKKKPILNKSNFFEYLTRTMNTTSHDVGDESFIIWKPFYYFIPFYLFLRDDYPVQFEEIRKKCAEYILHYNTGDHFLTYFENDKPQLVPLYGLAIFMGYVCDQEVFRSVNRQKLYDYLMSCKNSDNSFSSRPNSERDLRTTFSAIFVAWMFNILTDELKEGVLEYTLSCYNFDGGFSGTKNNESHSGFVCSGVNILYILGELDKIDIHRTIRYASMRQANFDGGYNGRPNKLSDTCYAWWLGSPMRVLADHIGIEPYWNQEGISEYILRLAQGMNGGFSDTPSANPDHFHTLFGSLGLFVSGCPEKYGISNPPKLHPVCGIPMDKYEIMKDYFYALPPIKTKH